MKANFEGKMVVLRSGRVVGPLNKLKYNWVPDSPWYWELPDEDIKPLHSSWWTIDGRWFHDGRKSTFDIVAIVDDAPTSLEDYM